jgi:glutaredoxin-related protein
MCGLSGNVCSMLRKNGVDFIEINILEDPELYLLLKEECVSATAPYLFVEGKFIGGYDEIKLLFETEKLVGAVR